MRVRIPSAPSTIVGTSKGEPSRSRRPAGSELLDGHPIDGDRFTGSFELALATEGCARALRASPADHDVHVKNAILERCDER